MNADRAAPRRARGGWLMPLGNMAMRGASLAARFALSIYVARMLGFGALGLFGLLAGLAGVAPALLGLGVSYHINRAILRSPRPHAYRLLRDRLALSLAAAALAMLAAVAAVAIGLLPRPACAWIGAGIVALEVIAFDLHIALINLGRPIAANFLLFVRSASWIAPVIALGLLDPSARRLDLLLGGWLAALVVNFALLLLILRDAPLAALRRTPVDWRALLAHARRTPLIYLNDLAVTGQVYIDRFLVAQILGLAAAGVYTLCFSVAHGLYVLTASAVTQLSMPRLTAAREAGGLSAWRAVLLSEARRAVLVAVAVVAVAGAATLLLLLPALGFAEFRRAAALFALMLAAAIAKPLADLTNAALYSLDEDRALALVNLAGVAGSVALGVVCLWGFGLVGIGVSALATQAGLILTRAAILRHRLAR